MNTTLKLCGTTAMLFLLVGAASTNLASATTNSSSNATAQTATCENEVANTYSGLDKSTAATIAANSQEYVQEAAGYQNVSYSSIFQIDKTIAPYPKCTEEVLSYNIVFTLHSNSGRWAGYLVITENQNLSVMGAQVQTGFGMAAIDTTWSGYEVQGNSGGTQGIYEAISDFTQPTPSYPSTGCADSGACSMATWVGLTDASHGSTGNLAQDGTFANCVNSGCTAKYFAFYELLPASWIACTASNGGAVTISGGDTIEAATTNEAITLGYNYLYQFYIYDVTSGTSCYVTGQNYSAMTTPTRGEFIVENPIYCNGGTTCTCYPSYGCDSLPVFATVSFTGAEIYTGGNLGYINSYITGAYTMANKDNSLGIYGYCPGSAVTNVNYGTLNSVGDFTMTYSASNYTPEYNTGC